VPVIAGSYDWPGAVGLASLAAGLRLAPASVPVTATLIVGGAIASRDFFPGHHDAAAARAAGQPDIFMNIMTTSGLFGAYLSAWAGPDAVLRSLALRLGTANRPGDTMTLTGEVTAVELDGSGTTVTVDVRGDNARGRHAAGRAVLSFPRHLRADDALPAGPGPGQ
jgi:acyl dehydratase